MSAAEAVAADERRHARDRWQAAGGSRRRPLSSFSTAAERRERRGELRAERDAAYEAIRTDADAHAEWVAASMLNPHLAAGNAAIVSQRLPGRVVGTARYWRGCGAAILRGERAAIYLDGGPRLRFGPEAAYALAQTSLAGSELADLEDQEGGDTDTDDRIPW